VCTGLFEMIVDGRKVAECVFDGDLWAWMLRGKYFETVISEIAKERQGSDELGIGSVDVA